MIMYITKKNNNAQTIKCISNQHEVIINKTSMNLRLKICTFPLLEFKITIYLRKI